MEEVLIKRSKKKKEMLMGFLFGKGQVELAQHTHRSV